MDGVLKLLQNQLGLWELRRRLEDVGKRPGRCLEGSVAYGPCVLISRECGSGGSLIARRVATRLGWHVFDREIVDDIARLAHVRQPLFESVAHDVRSQWENFWAPELSPADIGAENYLRYLRQVILTLGHHGDVVILGRAAHHLLPATCSLRVRVIAPREWRAESLVARSKVSWEAAQRQVDQFDGERAEFLRQCFHHEPGAPLDYDLVINTAGLGIEPATNIILTALQEKLGVKPMR